jgi:predicted unusual protein kinase regulating ubiquinone biosynthesis (AarF/ABC1/UbiB family)
MIRSGTICASFLYNYLMSDSESKDDNGNTLTKHCQKLRCLSDTLQSYGGVMSKLSQLLSLGDQNSSVFNDCKPFSKEKTVQFLKDYITSQSVIGDSPYNNISDLDFTVYKSGSVGQINRCRYTRSTPDKSIKIILKTQYVGLIEQTFTDLKMLDKIATYLYYFADMQHAMVDIKTKMYEELDYELETKNQILMWNTFKDVDYVEIPKVIPELCTDKIIAMQYINGKSIKDFIQTAEQDDKNKAGMCIVKFVFTSLYVYGMLYSDTHYGNFLVKRDMSVAVLDFGCLHRLDDKLLKNLRQLYIAVRDQQEDDFYVIVQDMGIMKSDITENSKKYMYTYFSLQYEPWVSNDFEFTEEWLSRATAKDTFLMKEWSLPQNMVYLNKIPYGLTHILTKLGLRGNFRELFDSFFTQ